MRERMLAGELYIADDPDLARDAQRAMTLTHRLNLADPSDHALRREILDSLLGAFGEGSEIRPPFRCDYGYQTYVGARTFANFGLISLDVATVRIGDDVQIGPNVQLLTALHPVAAGPRRDKWEAARPDRDRRQRVARRRRDRATGRDDRCEHGRGRGRRRDPGSAGGRGCGR